MNVLIYSANDQENLFSHFIATQNCKTMIFILAFANVVLGLYSGRSYENYGYYKLSVESESDFRILRNLDERFPCIWLHPHEG